VRVSDEMILELLDCMSPRIAELSKRVEEQAGKFPAAQRLMTHPGVGLLPALAFVLIVGRVERFGCGSQVASYLGFVPEEDSSGEHRRLGHIRKQGNSRLRFLLVGGASDGAQRSAVARQRANRDPCHACLRLLE
jgi:transposase